MKDETMLRQFINSRLAEQIDAYYTLAATTSMLPLLQAAHDYFQIVKNNPLTVSNKNLVPDSAELREFTEVLMPFRAVVAGWTNPILQYVSSANVPSRVTAFAPKPRSWPDHFEAVAKYAKGRFYVDQLLVTVSTLEGALGIMLDDVGENYEELTLGRKWGKVIDQIKKGSWGISQQLQTDIAEVIDRRNMVIHHEGKYVAKKYDLSKHCNASCYTKGKELLPAKEGDVFSINAWYVFHTLDVIGQLGDEVTSP